jgi:hypothetical protein
MAFDPRAGWKITLWRASSNRIDTWSMLRNSVQPTSLKLYWPHIGSAAFFLAHFLFKDDSDR